MIDFIGQWQSLPKRLWFVCSLKITAYCFSKSKVTRREMLEDRRDLLKLRRSLDTGEIFAQARESSWFSETKL